MCPLLIINIIHGTVINGLPGNNLNHVVHDRCSGDSCIVFLFNTKSFKSQHLGAAINSITNYQGESPNGVNIPERRGLITTGISTQNLH